MEKQYLLPEAVRNLFPYFRWCGFIATCCIAYISARFGWISEPESWGQAAAQCIAFGLCTFAVSYLPTLIYWAYRNADYATVGIGAAILLIATPFDFMSSAGGVGTSRSLSIQQSDVQNVKWDDKRQTLADLKSTESLWVKRLDKLESENGGWLTSVTAEGLKKRLPGLNLAIELEAGRGGCGPICEEKTKMRDEVESRIATIDKRVDIEAQIVATRALIEKARDNSAVVEKGTSPSAAQSGFMAKLTSMSTATPDVSTREAANLSYSVLFGLLGILLGLINIMIFTMDGTPTSRPNPPKSTPRREPEPQYGLPQGSYRTDEGSEAMAARFAPKTTVRPSQHVPEQRFERHDTANVTIVKDDEARRLRENLKRALAPHMGDEVFA